MAEPGKDDDFCLKWNNHHSTFMTILHNLMKREFLVDVTLAAEGKFIEAHKLVLCTCSDYFQDALSSHNNKQAYIFLNNVAFDDLQALVEYMYMGEVNVSQEQLPRFLAAAEALKIKGLSDKGAILSNNEVIEPDEHQTRIQGSKVSNSPSTQAQHDQSSSSILSFETSPLQDETLNSPSPVALFAESTIHQQEPDDNFISVNTNEEDISLEEHVEEDGLGTLGKVWSISQENDRVSSDARQNVTVKGECYVPHLTEVEVSNSSIDYQHQYYPVSATLHVDPVLSAPGNEEARPGPSAAVIARRIGNQPYYKHSTVVQSAVTTNSRGKIVCPTCGRVYTQKGSLNRHLKFECGIVPKFACQVCPMRFRRAYKLTEHYNRVHGGLS